MDEKTKLLYKLQHDVEMNLLEKYGIFRYLSSVVLSVHPNYEGRRIAQHLILARDAIAKKYELPMSASIFTSNAAIAAAKKAGYKFENGLR